MAEIELNLAKTNKCAGAFERIDKLFKTFIQLKLFYEYETWVINKNLQRKIEIYEKKILQKICGRLETSECKTYYDILNNIKI